MIIDSAQTAHIRAALDHLVRATGYKRCCDQGVVRRLCLDSAIALARGALRTSQWLDGLEVNQRRATIEDVRAIRRALGKVNANANG